MPPKVLLVRADGNAKIGSGHVMRCVALGQAWQDRGGRVVFALARGGEEIHERLRAEGFEVQIISNEAGSVRDAHETCELCAVCGSEWLVLDGYDFSPEYRERIKESSARLLFVDDHGACAPYECDIVVNANVYAAEAMYRDRRPETRFLLGSGYALLRREFVQTVRRADAEAGGGTRILLTLGGADPHNVTEQVIDALREVDEVRFELTVVLGASNVHRESVERALEKLRRPSRVLVNVSDMPEVMVGADMAISAGGGTCDELAFLRVPMFLITIADNQEQAVEGYARSNAAVSAGWFKVLERAQLARDLRSFICNRSLRNELAANAGKLVDGRGAQRIVDAMDS